MKVSLGDNFEFDLFQIEEIQNAEQVAQEINGSIYSWKTSGVSNWLGKGLSVVDVLGFTVLPKESPDWIDLPNDKEK